jgi:hypothetical protein
MSTLFRSQHLASHSSFSVTAWLGTSTTYRRLRQWNRHFRHRLVFLHVETDFQVKAQSESHGAPHKRCPYAKRVASTSVASKAELCGLRVQ